MPSIYTHYHFANEVEKNVNINIGEKDIYNVFAQSFDFLFYYNFLSLRKGKHIRSFGRFCHRNKTQEYLLNIIQYIKENKLNKNAELLGYLYGSITHYVLDSTMHPYINYLMKIKNEKGAHSKIEFNIDSYYYELDKNTPIFKYKLSDHLIKQLTFSQELIKALNEIYYKTFNEENIGEIYQKSYNQSKWIFKLFMEDRFGFKRKIYKVLDYIPLKLDFKFSNCSLYIKESDKSFLNLNKNKWYNISNKDKLRNESWDELYKKALKKAIKLITECDNYFNNKQEIKILKKLIPNITYSNGIKIK